MIDQLLEDLNRLTLQIKKITTININSKRIKEYTINLGTFYFKNARQEILGIAGDTELLHIYDENWQHLIRLAHGNNPKNTYLKLIKQLAYTTKELNIKSRSIITEPESTKINYSEAEQLLTSTLEKLVPSAEASYKQGIQDLNEKESRLSYRGTACEFREALREILDCLAPDKEVMQEPNFKLEEKQTRPTMKQKVRFILSSRGMNKTKRISAEKTVQLIETLCGDIARAVYDRASLSAHIETSKNEVAQLKRYMDALLFDLLEIT